MAVEDVLSNQEASLPCHRQTSFVNFLDENLRVHLRQFSFHGYCFIIDPTRLARLVETTSWGSSITQKERKFLISDCKSVGTQTRPKVLTLLHKLREKYPWDRIFGTTICGLSFHFIREPTRFHHCFALSDAIDLAMKNLGIVVKFPGKISRSIPKNCSTFRKRLHLANLNGKWYMTFNRLTTDHRRFHLLLHYLRVFPKGLTESDYVKRIKISLAGEFSLRTNQEIIPDHARLSFPLFPKETQDRLNRKFKWNRGQLVTFYYNLLQSKSLCYPVGEDMIQETYSKHRTSLCRSPEDVLAVPDQMLSELREYGQNVGKRVQELYNPFITSLPNTRACVERGRDKGGNLKDLEAKEGRMKFFNSSPLLQLDPDVPRMEPYVIGLFGAPGSGKTTLTQRLISLLSSRLFPHLSKEKLVYSRTSGEEYWSGYRQQPIVVMDDFGQSHSDRNDVVEFETVVSVNDYIVPMADLSEKGQKFTSPIIILTSNCRFGSNLAVNGSTFIEEPWAVWRRIDLPLFIQRGTAIQPVTMISKYAVQPTPAQQLAWADKHTSYVRDRMTTSCAWSNAHVDNKAQMTTPYHKGIYNLVTEIVDAILSKSSYHSRVLGGTWSQTISSLSVEHGKSIDGIEWEPQVCPITFPYRKCDWTRSLEFPNEPPLEPPTVKAIALPEPLKVRMITAAESDTKVLQPFQKALWTYLGEQEQFCLTNGVKTLDGFEDETLPWIDRIEHVIQRINDRRIDEDLWLSGDYTSATDNFPLKVTEALIEGILSEIDHEPTKAWVRWEISPHRIIYPKKTNLEVGEQTSGQLMGSLLSFPLLCFLNDYIVSSSGFQKGKYLINGDDVVALGPNHVIQNWQQRSPQVGLSLSIGKNFIDKSFCTINSQLFVDAKVCHTGKVMCQTRADTTLGYCFEEAQFYWGHSDSVKYEFLKRNLIPLKKTPRSLHLERKLGGLGLYNTLDTAMKYDMKLMKKVYLRDYLSPFMKTVPIFGDDSPCVAVAIPVIRGEGAKAQSPTVLSGADTVNWMRSLMMAKTPDSDMQKDLQHSDLTEYDKRIADSLPEVRDISHRLISGGKFNILEFPKLDWVEIEYVFITKGKASFVRHRALLHALHFLYQYLEDSTDLAHSLTFEGGVLEDLPGMEFELIRLSQLMDSPELNLPWIMGACDETEDDTKEWFLSSELDLIDLSTNSERQVFKPLPHDCAPIYEFLGTFMKPCENSS